MGNMNFEISGSELFSFDDISSICGWHVREVAEGANDTGNDVLMITLVNDYCVARTIDIPDDGKVFISEPYAVLPRSDDDFGSAHAKYLMNKRK